MLNEFVEIEVSKASLFSYFAVPHIDVTDISRVNETLKRFGRNAKLVGSLGESHETTLHFAVSHGGLPFSEGTHHEGSQKTPSQFRSTGRPETP